MKRFKHDCKACMLLGHFEEYDLYFCVQNGLSPTVIARYGNEGWEYTSGIGSGNPALQEAEVLALELLVTA